MLKKTYYRETAPWELQVTLSEEQMKTAVEIERLENYLLTRLPEEDGNKMRELIELIWDYLFPEDCKAFAYGFKMCFKLLKEVNFKMEDLVADVEPISGAEFIAALVAMNKKTET